MTKPKTIESITLFDEWLHKAEADTKAKKKADRQARPKGQKCSTCDHCQRHLWSKKYWYCTLGKSDRTDNGFATTTPGNWCSKWKEEA